MSSSLLVPLVQLHSYIPIQQLCRKFRRGFVIFGGSLHLGTEFSVSFTNFSFLNVFLGQVVANKDKEVGSCTRLSQVFERPATKGPSLERLLGAWKAAEEEARRKKEAEVEAAHKVKYRNSDPQVLRILRQLSSHD